MITCRKPKAFPAESGHLLYARRPQDKDYSFVGVLKQPPRPDDFDGDFYLTLDAGGKLCVHAGEVPYWTTTDPIFFRDNPGCVLVDRLEQRVSEPDQTRDPFSGTH